MGEACRALDFPVVSGNVSLYNETNGVAILPTPTIGAIGLIDDVARAPTIALRPGLALVLVGVTAGWLGASRFLLEVAGAGHDFAPPPVDLEREKANGALVAKLLGAGAVNVVHDLSAGGLAVGLAKMALAGDTGADIAVPAETPALPWLFGEDQARYLLATEDAAAVLAAAAAAGVPAAEIGRTGGDALTVSGVLSISLDELRHAHEGWLPTYMTGA